MNKKTEKQLKSIIEMGMEIAKLKGENTILKEVNKQFADAVKIIAEREQADIEKINLAGQIEGLKNALKLIESEQYPDKVSLIKSEITHLETMLEELSDNRKS